MTVVMTANAQWDKLLTAVLRATRAGRVFQAAGGACYIARPGRGRPGRADRLVAEARDSRWIWISPEQRLNGQPPYHFRLTTEGVAELERREAVR